MGHGVHARDGTQAAKPLWQRDLSAIGLASVSTWYGGCVTSGIARRWGGAHTRRIEMKQLAQIVGSFWHDEDGQDLLEYALLVALIALVAVAGVTAAGVRVKEIFNAIVAAIPLPAAA